MGERKRSAKYYPLRRCIEVRRPPPRMHPIDFSLPITHPVAIFGLAMTLILVVPIVLRWLKVPDVVGLLMAGVLIGPNALGLLARDPTIILLGTVGVLYIMFEAGLEVDLNEFQAYKNKSLVFGALTFFFPIGIGTFLGKWALDFSWPSAILLGSLFASHTLLSYPIVSKLGLSKRESVTTAIGGTIITDTAALLVLAVVANAAQGQSGLGFWAKMIAFLAVYTVAAMVLIPLIGRWFFRTFRSGGQHFVFVLAVVFITAFMAEVAGVEAIIGAFLAGLTLNRLVPPQSTLMNRIHFVGEYLFIPFFLFSVGMLVDFRVLVAGWEAWIVAGTMLFAVISGKWVAAQLARPTLGYRAEDAGLLFGLSIPQAAATLAAALVGFNIGLFNEYVLNGAILMMLVTCIMGPLATEYYGRKVAADEERASAVRSVQQRILVPLANPETAGELVDLALLFREPKAAAPLYPLTVARAGDDEETQVILSEKLLSAAITHTVAADVPVRPITRIDLNIANGITRAIREERISTVVMGWNSQSTALSFIFGNVLDQVLKDSRCEVAVCRTVRPLNTHQRVVVVIPPGIRREPGFGHTLHTLRHLVGQLGCTLHLVVSENEHASIRRRVETLFRPGTFRTTALAGWGDLLGELTHLLKLEDVLVLVNVREGTVAWRPALNRLPNQLATTFATHSFVTLYVQEGGHSVPEADHVALSGFVLEVPAAATGLAPEAFLQHLVSLMFPGTSDAHERVLHRLTQLQGQDAVEAGGGVAVLHAHTSLAHQPELLVARSASGLPCFPESGSVHTLLLLFVPADVPSPLYLALFQRVMRLAHQPEDLDAYIQTHGRPVRLDL